MSDEFEPDDAAAKQADLLTTLEDLKTSHRRLDTEITALRENGAVDMINIARMKKQKLILKDKITRLKNSITPDIIA